MNTVSIFSSVLTKSLKLNIVAFHSKVFKLVNDSQRFMRSNLAHEDVPTQIDALLKTFSHFQQIYTRATKKTCLQSEFFFPLRRFSWKGCYWITRQTWVFWHLPKLFLWFEAFHYKRWCQCSVVWHESRWLAEKVVCSISAFQTAWRRSSCEGETKTYIVGGTKK